MNLVAIWIVGIFAWNLAISPQKHLSFEELLIMVPSKHYVNKFNICKTFKGVSNNL